MWSFSPGEDQQRPPLGVLAVDLCLGPGVQVGRRGLEQRRARRRHVERLVELLRLVVAQGVGPSVPELIERERDGAAAVGGVCEHRHRRPQRGDRKRQHAAEGRGIDRNRGRGQSASAMIWVSSPPKEWPITAGFLVSFPITSPTWSATCPTVFWQDLWVGLCLLDGLRVVRPGGSQRAYPASSKTVAQRSQLLGSSQSPWMNTTGVSRRVGTIDLLGFRSYPSGFGHARSLERLVHGGHVLVAVPLRCRALVEGANRVEDLGLEPVGLGRLLYQRGVLGRQAEREGGS